MAYLVTGCAGFIGSHLCETLLGQGKPVRGIDCFTDYYAPEVKRSNIANFAGHKSFTLVEGDLLTADFSTLLDGVDCVFHTAGQPGVRASWGTHFDDYVTNNILATQRLLESIKSINPSIRVVYSSSSSIYGNTNVLPTGETTLPQPYSPYGTTKLAAEHLCHLYFHNYRIPVVSLRYFTVYGPRQRPDMLMHKLVKALLKEETIPVYGDGKQTRDFTYVADIVQANLLAAQKPVEGEVFNIGGGSRVSVLDVLSTLQAVSGIAPKTEFFNANEGDVRDTWADTSKAKNLLGFQPSTSLEEGIRNEFEWGKRIYS